MTMTTSKTSTISRPTPSPRPGFSLIEVLISIVVLSIGLLGLAAVFPVVVTQQRQASDSVQGTSIERSVIEYLTAHSSLNQPSEDLGVGSGTLLPDEWRGWDRLRRDPKWSESSRDGIGSGRDGAWQLPLVSGGATGSKIGLAIDESTGVLMLGSQQKQDIAIRIPVADRLIPRPFTTDDAPRFVWDVAARRIMAGEFGAPEDDAVQVAIFVRRVDSGIRRPADVSVADVLVRSPRTRPLDGRVPVAANDKNIPTYDGRGGDGAKLRYSAILDYPFTLASTGTVLLEKGRYGDRIGMSPEFNRDLFPYVTQVGQKLVDPVGDVHTVTGLWRDKATNDILGVLIDPPLSDRFLTQWVDRGGQLRVIYTPQVPASVSVTTFAPPVSVIN